MPQCTRRQTRCSPMFAIIPAAGHSTRMGRPKLSLSIGHRTVIERVLDALREADCTPLLVLAPHAMELAETARAAGALVLQLSQPTTHMRATIELGLEHLSGCFHPSANDAWLLVPADHPVLDPMLIRRLREELTRRPEFSLALPTFHGQRGHPTLIRWSHHAGICSFSPEHGLNRYLRQFETETLQVAVDSSDILLDLDTPDDYERICRRFAAACTPH